MSANPLVILDALDAARAAATPGEWVHNPVNGIHTPTGTCIALSHRHDDEKRRADAALIVAAVNALPHLTAALRAVEALCAAQPVHEGFATVVRVADIRAALAAALEAS